MRHKKHLHRGQRKDSWFVPESSGDDDEESTTSTFGIIEFVTGRKSASSTEYESLIDHGESAGRLNLAGIKQQCSDNQSSFENHYGGHMACEDLVNVDDDLQIKNCLKPKPVIEERHSMPTYFVGNRFNALSTTQIYIPNWKDRQDSRVKKDTPATPHSSVLRESPDTTDFLDNAGLLAPPEAFKSILRSLTREASFSKHSLNSDKRMSNTSHKSSLIFTPRSSDSGMAGSVSISSPDYLYQTKPIVVMADNSDSGQYECASLLKTQISDGGGGGGGSKSMNDSCNHAELVINLTSCDNTAIELDGGHKIYRTGLYAHWWKKEQLPQEVVREIVLESHKDKTEETTPPRKGSGKHIGVSHNIQIVLCVFLANSIQSL